MKPERLDINDKRFLINRLIEQAPVSTMVREFFKNADESAALAPAGNRRIEIYPVEIDGVRKLAFWNTGPGLDDVELRQATDLSSSVNKNMSMEGNFGIGAKVSGLTMSKAGIRYRSCKNRTVWEVTIGYDDDEETYVRFPVELPDGHQGTVYDVTTAAVADGKPTDFDWTEVVLFGETDDHDTVAEPLGKGRTPTVDRSYVPTTIFRRFAAFSDGVEVRIDVAMTKGGGKDETGTFRQLKPLSDVLDKLPRTERIHDPDSGLTIHYVHDPKHPLSSHSLSARANPATSSTTFCAVVHKGERYDFKNTKAWAYAAPKFGVPFGSKVLTIEIEIPDSMALPNQYRDGLTWPEDRSPLTAEDFADYVRELMPDWVKEVIRSESPESDENLDDLQTDLQKLLDEFRVPTLVFSPSRKPSAIKTESHSEGMDTVQRLKDDLDLGGEGEFNNGDQQTARSSARAKPNKLRRAPAGSKPSRAMQALERVPEITILTDPDQISEKCLKGRAGRYYGEAQMLFVNGHYPIVDRIAGELERELAGVGEPEVVRSECLRSARRSVAFRIGKVTCFAISKRLSDDWSMEDLEKATSPESLSMAADDYKQGQSVAKKWARDMIRAFSLEERELA